MPPLDYEANGDIIEMGGSNAVTLEYRLNGLREGAMFTYLDDPDVYHCPADHRVARGTPNGSEAWYKIFRSYSMPTGMASNTTTQQRSSMGRFQPILKADDIRQPSSKYIFVEEVYDGYTTGANYNDKSWTFKPYGIGSSYLYELQDPLGQFHVKACTFAYADGHAGRYKFQDNETLKFWEDRLAYGGSNSNIGSFPGNLDCEWLADGFPYVR
jgi:prepilin-type processing-associated H-X9-DG protein